LIIHGPRTYSDFLSSQEHISTNILASRLSLLTHLKLIERTAPHATRNNAYRITKSGAELRPILQALGKWAGKHLSDFHENITK